MRWAWRNGKLLQGQLGTLFEERYGKLTRKTKLLFLQYIFGEADPFHDNLTNNQLLDLWEQGKELAPVDELKCRTIGIR